MVCVDLHQRIGSEAFEFIDIEMKTLNDLSWGSASTQTPSDSPASVHTIEFDADHEKRSATTVCDDYKPIIEELSSSDIVGFYNLMRHTRDLRREIVYCLLKQEVPYCQEATHTLKSALARLQATPRPHGWTPGDDDDVHMFVADSTTTVCMRLQYEKRELLRDILFFEHGDHALMEALAQDHEKSFVANRHWVEPHIPSWECSLSRALATMHAASATHACERSPVRRFRNFITDRDGTVNNYCDRYSSCVQSGYNAAWIADFARHCTEHTMLVTAAPLGARPCVHGLVELCTMPDGFVTYAGSKGREYLDNDTKTVQEVEPLRFETYQLLESLYSGLATLCARPGNEKFLGLGSGLQRKFGEITLARNDPTKSVSDEESHRFFCEIKQVIHEIDPDGNKVELHDTGTDVEISPYMSNGRPGFSKSDGIISLDKRLDLQIAEGPNLVCGDTASDLPMLEATLRLMTAHGEIVHSVSGAPTTSAAKLAVLFVITPEQHQKTPLLASQVRSLCDESGAHCAILPSPDVLVAALARFTRDVAIGGLLTERFHGLGCD